MHRLRTLGLSIFVCFLTLACGSSDPSSEIQTASRTPDATPILADAAIQLTKVAEMESPTAMATRSDSENLYVTEVAGAVRVLTPAADGSYRLDPEPLIDLSDEIGDPRGSDEAGLLGIAFSPDGRYVYLSDTAAVRNAEREAVRFRRRVLEFRMLGDDVDVASRRTILSLDSQTGQNNGGGIAFGPDGYLFVTVGDASPGGEGDKLDTGQDPTDLYGGILRVDPRGAAEGEPYAIPPNNPYVDGVGGAPEVLVYGARHPWRMSFDADNGDLWVVDVGELHRDEINYLPPATVRGANLGWSEVEGTIQFEDGEEPSSHTEPIFEYDHEGGCAVVGGFVYRGEAIPNLRGAYLFSDLCSRRITAITHDRGELSDRRDFDIAVVGPPLAFGQNHDHELYLLTSAGVFRIDPAE